MTHAQMVIVFEGPDNVGKSTFANEVAKFITKRKMFTDVNIYHMTRGNEPMPADILRQAGLVILDRAYFSGVMYGLADGRDSVEIDESLRRWKLFLDLAEDMGVPVMICKALHQYEPSEYGEEIDEKLVRSYATMPGFDITSFIATGAVSEFVRALPCLPPDYVHKEKVWGYICDEEEVSDNSGNSEED